MRSLQIADLASCKLARLLSVCVMREWKLHCSPTKGEAKLVLGGSTRFRRLGGANVRAAGGRTARDSNACGHTPRSHIYLKRYCGFLGDFAGLRPDLRGLKGEKLRGSSKVGKNISAQDWRLLVSATESATGSWKYLGYKTACCTWNTSFATAATAMPEKEASWPSSIIESGSIRTATRPKCIRGLPAPPC